MILATFLVACAATKPAHDAPAHPSTAQAEAQAGTGSSDAKHWSPSLRTSVLLQCQRSVPDEALCYCLTRQLEVLSPDPEVEFTQDDIDTGLSRCQ